MGGEAKPDQGERHVRMVFVGAGLWRGPVPHLEDEWGEPPAHLQAHLEDVFPFPVPISAPLEVGQEMLLPDQITSPWRIVRVLHNYDSGLHFPPTTWVVLTRA